MQPTRIVKEMYWRRARNFYFEQKLYIFLYSWHTVLLTNCFMYFLSFAMFSWFASNIYWKKSNKKKILTETGDFSYFFLVNFNNSSVIFYYNLYIEFSQRICKIWKLAGNLFLFIIEYAIYLFETEIIAREKHFRDLVV